jgi:pimeloyl-ACP methyl ester carboxylesterase
VVFARRTICAYNVFMEIASAIHEERGPTAVPALPWSWFEFRAAPRAAVPPLPADPEAVYGVEADGQVIPFKFLRKPPMNGHPRPVVMVLHGMGLTIASFRGVAGYLLATHDVLCPDYSGFSLHRALPDQTSFKGIIRALWRLADVLGIERLSLAANSLGGGLALMAALQAPPRVERIVLANPATFPQDLPTMYKMARLPLWGEVMMALTSPYKLIKGLEYTGYVDTSRLDPWLRAIYMANLARLRTRLRLMQIIRQLPANPWDLAAVGYLRRLAELRQPVLVSWGAEDPLLAREAGERLAQALPHATFELHPDLSHLCHEEAPERIGPRWAEFLNGNGKG